MNNYVLADGQAEPPNSSSYWAIDGLLLAGAYPGDADAVKHRQKIQTLLDAGVRTFINLMEPDETDHHGQPFARYDALVEQHGSGSTCIRLPIRDLSVPSVEHMHAVLNTIDDSLENGRPAYVHCWGGVGRTGTVVGCWLLRHRLATSEKVLDILARLRRQDGDRGYRESPETSEQRQFVLQWKECRNGTERCPNMTHMKSNFQKG